MVHPSRVRSSRHRCESAIVPQGMHRESRYGALHHIIAPALLRRLRAYYYPSNQRLYKFLGRDLGWETQ